MSFLRKPWTYPAVVLLLLLPLLLFLLLVGRPGLAPGQVPLATGPIAGPAPPLGLPKGVPQRLLLVGALFLGLSGGLGLGAVFFFPEKKRPLPPRRAFWTLLLVGMASLAAYGLCFWKPFPLRRYYNLSQVSIGLIALRDRDVALALALVTVALFFLYAVAYACCRGQKGRRLWAVVLVGALLLALLNTFVATLTTLDPYDYIARGRITGVYQGNPYRYPPEEYADPFMEYTSWKHKTSAYGPLWEALSALIGRLAGEQLWPQMLAYKGLALLSYLLCVLLIAAILRRTAPKRALADTLFFAWNPLVLQEALANAHNDILMVLFLLAAFWVLARSGRRKGSAVGLFEESVLLLLVGASVLVKFVPVLLLPFFLCYLLVGRGNWGRRLAMGAVLLAPVLLLVGIYSLPFWAWPEVSDTFLRRVEMFRTSVPSVGWAVLQERIGGEAARAQIGRVFMGLFVLAYLVLALRTAHGLGWAWAPRVGERLARRKGLLRTLGLYLAGRPADPSIRPWDTLVQAGYHTFLLYLLLASFWTLPWYLIWPLALLALARDKRTLFPLVWVACIGELSHLAWNFVWYWWGISWETVYQVDALVVAVMLLPALFFYLVGGVVRYLRGASASG